MQTVPRIMVVDDERYTRLFFERILTENGYQVELVDNGKDAIARFQKRSFHLVLLDLKMPGLSGEETLKQLYKIDKNLPIIIITAYGNIINFDKMLKMGAIDFFTKPFVEVSDILSKINDILLKKETKSGINELKGKTLLSRDDPFLNIIGKSPKIKNVIKIAKTVSSSFCSTLIQGESGTGKELFAKAIHQMSPLKDKPFMPINCGALPDNLLQSILFGYEKGAFTDAYQSKKGVFEVIDGGTLFLDEIVDTSLNFQLQLLRVLQNNEYMRLGSTEAMSTDFRLILSTNKNIELEVKKENFRHDLFYRINVITLHLPTLRERKDDIPLLLDYYLSKFCKIMGVKKKRYSKAALDILCDYTWEGNVREVENFSEGIVVLSRNREVIEPDNLPEKIKNGKITNANLKLDAKFNIPFKVAKLKFEKEYITGLLKETSGDLQIASQLAGINLATLYRKIRKYKI